MASRSKLERVVRLLAITAAVLCVAAGWRMVGPTALGGTLTYLVPDGQSMLPTLTRDDLVVVRPQESYGPGQVVAYRSDLMHQPIVHRIVRVDDGRYVMQGDNNSWVDPDRPDTGEVIGAVWYVVPGVGGVLTRLSTPKAAAALALAVGFLAAGGLAALWPPAPKTVPGPEPA